MSIKQIDYDFKLDGHETPDLKLENAANPTIIHRITGTNGTLKATGTTPIITDILSDRVQLSGGVATIDLTNLDNGDLPNKDWTGLKVQGYKIVAASSNGDDVTVKAGSTDGYDLFGAGGLNILGPGAIVMGLFNEQLPDVASGAKIIAISSPDVDAIVDIQLIAS